MSKVPPEIVGAVNALLAAYGETYIPGGGASVRSSGCVNTRDACEYLGISRSSLSRLVRSGALRPIRYNRSARNGLMAFARADLDEYIESCRSASVMPRGVDRPLPAEK